MLEREPANLSLPLFTFRCFTSNDACSIKFLHIYGNNGLCDWYISMKCLNATRHCGINFWSLVLSLIKMYKWRMKPGGTKCRSLNQQRSKTHQHTMDEIRNGTSSFLTTFSSFSPSTPILHFSSTSTPHSCLSSFSSKYKIVDNMRGNLFLRVPQESSED